MTKTKSLDPIAAPEAGNSPGPAAAPAEAVQAERGPLSLGEYRVGVTFNPSKSELVDAIKARAASLLDLIDSIPTDIDLKEADHAAVNAERVRLKTIAAEYVENAAMWAVKAATKA